MYARSVPGSRADPARERDSNGIRVLPKDDETAPTTPIPQPAELQQQQRRYQQQQGRYQEQQHQHQHHEQNATQIPHSHPARPTYTRSPETSARLSPGRTVERLAHRLSEQNLQRSHPSRDQPQPQPTALLPSSSASVEIPEVREFRRWAESEVRGPSQQHAPNASSYHHGYRNIPWVPISMPDVGEPIEVDEEYQDRPDDRRLLDVRRPRRQTSSQLRGVSSTRPVDRRLEAMIASGTQCNVSESRPTSTPPRPLPPPSISVIAQPPYIEPDPDCAMPSPDLEVDDSEGAGVLELPSDLMDESIPLRYASGPGGIRKYTVGGIALRYRLSADAALRCANVVRSRPRMRKRHKTRHENGGSAATSAVTSPAMSMAGSPPLPATQLPP